MRRGEALYTALEHEAMHQETLLYMWHRLPHEQKERPQLSALRAERGAAVARDRRSRDSRRGRDAGRATATTIAFGWDNEFDAHTVDVPAFDIDVHSVTNADYLPFVEAGHVGAAGVLGPPGRARGSGAACSRCIPLPPAWPVYVSQEDASAFAAWKGRG